MKGSSDISKAFELILNTFKEFYKNKITDLVATKISKSLEKTMNKNFIEDPLVKQVGNSG